MKQALVQIEDEVNMTVRGLSPGDTDELYGRFAVYAKGYRHNPKYKLGIWDGKIGFFKKTGKTYLKLASEIIPYLKSRDYDIKLIDNRKEADLACKPIDKDYLKNMGYDVELGEHQVRGVNALLSNAGGIFEGGTGAGKAQPLTSKILTDKGWVSMGDIAIGDKVVDPVHGTYSNVTGIFPQGNKDIYEITFHDGSKARACKDHLWTATVPTKYGKTRRIKKTITTQDIIEFIERKKAGEYTPRNISIQTTCPVPYSDINTPIDPYLLGLLIGDGHLSGTPSFSSSDAVLVEYVKKMVNPLGLEVKYSDQYDYYLSKVNDKKNQHIKNKLTELLMELGLWNTKSHTKFIPEIYKVASIDTRLSLVQGLMDTDGTVDKKGSASYSTSSLKLAKDFQEICWSLGMVCTIKEKPTKRKLSYVLSIGCKTPRSLFRLERKKERCKQDWIGNRSGIDRRIVDVVLVSHEAAQCIMVDSEDHLYITDDYVVTHNTIMTAVLAHVYERQLGFRSIVIVPTSDLIDQTYLEMAEYGVDVGMYGGSVKDVSHTHLVSTWQSLQNNKGIIGQYDVVIVDECHGVRGQILQELLNDHANNALIRVGLTGTIPEEEIDQMHVRVTLGDVVERVEAHELIASGWLANLKLYCYEVVEDLREEYHDFCDKNPDKAADITYAEFRKNYLPDYQSEKKHIQKRPERLEFLAKLIAKPEKNTLVLVPNVEFGKKITKHIPNAVFFYGQDSKVIRKEIYDSFETNDDIIAITTFSLASTGLNIKRVFNLFLVDAGKSYVQVIQSIGRGLRRGRDKDTVCVYDVYSDLKFSKRHATNRKKHYKNKKYPFKTNKIDYLGFMRT